MFKTQSFHVAQKQLTSDGWRLESPEVLRLLDKLRNAGTPLGKYVNGRFYYGIKTGFNEAFVVDRVTRDRLIAEHPSSAEVLKPFLRGRDVKRWTVNHADLWLIFTQRGIDLNQYPAISGNLKQYKDRLKIRAGNCKWYELQASPGDTNRFECSKIIYPDIAARCEFAFDTDNLFPDCTLFVIPTESNYLMSFLNSNVVQFFIDRICPGVRGNYKRFKSIYIEQIPIPPVLEHDRATIEALIQKCLDAKGQDVEEWETEINDRVAHLYGLTAQEIKLIENMGGA